MKIYISGRISGMRLITAEIIFEFYELFLKDLGYNVVNPIKINHNHDLKWRSYMKKDIKYMMDCDAVFLLKNWKYSKGARIERRLAKNLNYTILEEL